jgi:hypothetical protein
MSMIKQGDGSMARLLSQQRCPSCKSLLLAESDDGYKKKYDCIVCGLKVVDVKDSEK